MRIKELFMKYKDKIITILTGIRVTFLPAIVGFLGSYAGSHGTSLLWRRAGIAVVVSVTAFLSSGMNPEIGWLLALCHITCMSLWGGYSLGYGIPDASYPPHGDSGSDIGRFWTLLFRKSMSIAKAHRMGDYFTRSTVAIARATALISVPIIKGNWICYLIGALGIVLTNALISWRPMGSFEQKIFGKNVEFLWSDICNFTIEGACYSLMIFGGF